MTEESCGGLLGWMWFVGKDGISGKFATSGTSILLLAKVVQAAE